MIINGSVREGRRADTVQAWVVGVLNQDTELMLDVVDLKELDLPFFNEALNPSDANGQFKNPKGTAWAARVAAADAFLFITPEYNHGPSAVLKNAIDWVYDGWLNKPIGFVSYGGVAGGTRAVQQLLQNVLHVKMFPISANVAIPNISTAFDEHVKPNFPSLDDNLHKSVADIKQLHYRLRA